MHNHDIPLGKKILGVLGIFAFIGIIVWNIWIDKNYNKNADLLMKHGQTTVGTVTQINSGYRSKAYIVFEYYVDGRRYLEETEYYSSKYDVNPGDRYEVMYYPNDPTIRKLNLSNPIINRIPLDSIKNTISKPFK